MIHSPHRPDAQVTDETASGNPSLEAWADLQKVENGSLRALFTMIFLEVTGFAMSMPVLAFFAIKELGLSPSQLGIVMSANAASQLVGSSICGRLSDSFGRRWLLLGSFLWSALNLGATAFVFSFAQFLALRTLGGLSGGTTPLCQAFIMDCVGEAKRPAFLGLFGCLIGVAFTSGNLMGVGLIMSGFERRTIFLIASFFALLATLFGAFSIDESLPAENRRTLECCSDNLDGKDPEKAQKEVSDCDVIGAGLICVWITRFFQALAMAALFANYGFLIDRVFGWSDVHFGVIMVFAGVLSAILQFAVYPLFGRHGKTGSAVASIVSSIAGACAAIVFATPVVLVHLLAIVLFLIASALFDPAVPVLVSLFVSRSHLGFGNGIAIACRCAASIVGPVAGGILFERGLDVLCWTVSVIYLLALGGSVGIAVSPRWQDDAENEARPLLAEKSATK